jgi:hypothetical protein
MSNDARFGIDTSRNRTYEKEWASNHRCLGDYMRPAAEKRFGALIPQLSAS